MADNSNLSPARQKIEEYRNNLRKRTEERMSRRSIADSLQEKNKEQAEKRQPLFAEFRNDKVTYYLISVSAVFTALLGLILGLAPERRLDPNTGASNIYFHTDFPHVMIAVVYMVAFVTVTEAAFMMAKQKFHTREEGNWAQAGTMVIMMALAALSIGLTGYYGSVIGASVLGFLSEFNQIPENAQEWVVKAIPLLISFYVVLLAVYKLSSQEERDKRLTDQLERQQIHDHKVTRKLTELEVAEMIAAAEDMAWLAAVERGVLTAGEVAGAKKAGKSLKQLEKERGEDLDGDGVIGNPVVRQPQPASNNGQVKDPQPR